MAPRLIICEQAESTQDLARAMAVEGAPDGTAVMAVNQTHGRGRRGRTWISPPGKNLAISLILRPGIQPRDAALLGLLASIAVARTVEQAGVGEVSLRWPNDVMAHGRKIAGILSEASMDDRTIEFVIMGIGLNINTLEGDFPADLATPATSVFMCTGRESRVEDMARDLLEKWDVLYRKVKTEGCAFVAPLWEQRWAHRGVTLFHETATGTGLGIDGQGALLMRTADGSLVRITSGEVTV